MKGWKFLYAPHIECPPSCPWILRAFQVQQARWAKGLSRRARRSCRACLRSDASWLVKLEGWCHLTANISYPLMLVLSVLLLPAMIVRFYQGWFQMLYIDLPLFMRRSVRSRRSTVVSQRELYPKTWKRTFLFVPFLMATGIGLTLTNTRAVMEALAGLKSPFQRTPKYGNVQSARYRRRSRWLPWVNLLIGSYFCSRLATPLASRIFSQYHSYYCSY